MRKIKLIIFFLLILLPFSLFCQIEQLRLNYLPESKSYSFEISDSLIILYDVKGMGTNYSLNRNIDTIGFYRGSLWDSLSLVSISDTIAIIRNYLSSNIIFEFRNSLRIERLTIGRRETTLETLYPNKALVVVLYERKARRKCKSSGYLIDNRYIIDEQKVYYKNGKIHYHYKSRKGYDVDVYVFKRNGKEIKRKCGLMTTGFIYNFRFTNK